ncbi:hypothetical protein H058_19230 [Vibrio antiquarius]|nr:hypothetical protein H058_19230 [Vibrio antiquarius]
MPNLKFCFEVDYHFANTVFMWFEKLKSGAVSKHLPMKSLGTYSAVEDVLTTPKGSFKLTVLQS